MSIHPVVLALYTVAIAVSVGAFSPASFAVPSQVKQHSWNGPLHPCHLGGYAASLVVMRNAEDESSESAEEAADTEEDPAETEEEEKENPEMVALKEEIASMEKILRTKRFDARKREEEAEEYTKTGYYRKVAEMDNFRKQRDVAFQNSKFVARASVMQKFLPVMAELDKLGEQYSSDEFGKQYDALRREFHNVMEKKLDLAQFDVAEGDTYNRGRQAVVGYEISDTVPKWNVVRQVTPGLEVKGNVVRFAEVVVSKGTEAEEKEAQEEAAAKMAKEAEAKLNKEKGAEQEEDDDDDSSSEA